MIISERGDTDAKVEIFLLIDYYYKDVFSFFRKSYRKREIEMNLEQAKEKLEKNGQMHVLKYYDELDDAQKQALLTQIEETDFEILKNAKNLGKGSERGKFAPLAATQLSEIEKRRDEFTKAGVEAIKAGKVAACLLAGGMGTRLGSDDPKGMYNIGLTKDVFIFQRIIENLLDVVKATDTWIHLFIMTSEKNHEKTVEFLTEKNFFGYKADKVTFFKQRQKTKKET